MAIEKTLDLMIAGQGARSLAPGWMSGVLDSWVAAVAESAASWALASGVGLVSVAQADSGIRDARLALDQALAGANPDMELEPLARALARAQALRVLAITAERIETARAEAEEDGTLHWRQGLCSPCLDASDDDAGEQASAPALVGSSSWIEGYALDAADALDMAARAAGGALRQWRDEDFIAGVRTDTALEASYRHLLAGIESYLTDPSAAYSSAYAIVLPSRLDDAFTAASGEWNSVLAGKARLRASFANAVNDWALACDPVALKDALPSMEICLNAARDSYELARTSWEQATSSFTAAGAAYETARQAAASLYTGLEDARFELEARKALQRWASTAYLSSEGERGVAVYRDPAAELAWCRDRLARSAAAVDVLAGLYAGDLSERPYDDPEYQAALAEFKARQTDAMLMAKAEATLSKTWTALSAERASALRAYWDIINGGESGMPFAQELPFEDYQALDTLSTAGWNDVLTVGADGRLALSRDADNRLVLNDADGARILADYFKPTEDGGPSRFQEALGNFSARIASYNLDGEQLYSWGLARDYLLSSVLRANPDAAVLSQDGPVSDSRLHDAINAVSVYYEPASNMLDEFRAQGLDVLRRRAWDKLGQEQKADLEMLLTLELSGSCQVAPLLNAIKDATRAAEYRYMEARFDHLIDQVSFILWPPNLVRYLYWKDARDSILSGPCDGFTREMDQGAKALNARASEMAKAWNRIQGVEKQLAALSLDGAGDVGDHIARAVKAAGGWSDEDVAGLKSACARQQAAIQEGSSLPELVAGMSEGCSQAAADATKNLEAVHSRKRADSNQLVADFQACYDGYLSGDTDEGAFRAAAALAYGAGSPSWSSHLRSLGAWTLDGLLSSPDTDPEFLEKAARSMVSLIERAWAERVAGERAVLADEYSLAFEDLAERWNAWNTAAGLILSRGRADFMQARSDMAERAEAWAAAFDKSYREKTLAWNAAALDAADSKLAWAERAALAADSAAKGGMLSLVGEDAEHGARALDLNQVGELRLACDPDGLLEKALASAGISGMAKALAWSGTAGQTTGVRTDDGFACSWDSAAIQASARSYAEDSRQRLSTGQAKLMARSARDAVDLAVSGLEDSVRQANFQFEDSMDELFMRQGGWSRYGRLYVKDVLSHSTLFDYAITERASVDTYREYRMDAWRPSTDLSDEASAGLDGAGLQELVRQAQEEVEKMAGAVFGTEDDETEDAIASRTRLFRFYREERYVSGMETITVEDRNGDLRTIERPVYSTRVLEDEGKLQKRTTGAGLFGAWLGYDPVLSDLPDVDEGLDDTFRDQGSGELGRLMSQYLYWSLKEGKGLGELAKPMYEKDLWDDRGSWLQAPNLRGIADIGVTIGAAVLSGGTSLGAMLVSAGINLADDAVFGALDVATGYKTWEEAGLEFGKKAVSSAMGAVVGSTGGLSSLVDPSLGFGHVLASTMLDGVQTVGMSLATSAINAVQWDGSGLVWSSDMFSAGVTGGLSGALAGAAGGITGGVMNLGLEGFVSDLASDARTLSAVLGGLAEQGVSYAMGGTASFNLFNLGVFGWKGEDGNAIRTGLLELSIGGDGIGLGLGQGGMDMSLGTIASALRGTEAWLVNARMAFSGQDEAGKYASALRSLYSAGKASGQDRTRFEQILSGKANILEDAEGAFSALTKYDTTNDTYTITLGKNVLEDSSRFGLNIVLAHEARRNGLNDGEDGQTKETQDAVIGHIELAAALGDTYGMNALTERQRAEVTALNEARKGYVAGMLDVFASYASEDDYWRLTVDGNLMYDGFKELRREFYLANGEVGVEFVEGSQEETTRGGALVHYLGEGRARTLLGGSADSLGTYDLESLKSVMPSLTQESLSALKDNGGTLADLNLTQAQKDQLLGESLMRKYGMAFDQDKGWSGKETVSFSLTDEDVGMIGIARVGANQYERFTVSMIVRRHPDAFDTWKDGSATNDYNVRDNSDIAFYKWALPGERLANGQEFERYAPQFQFTSIANTLGGENDRIWEVSIEDKDKVPHTYLSNTLASGTFNMRLIPSNGQTYGVNTLGLLSNAETIGGEYIGLNGKVNPDDKPWLFHNFGIPATSLGCIGPVSDNINYTAENPWKRIDQIGSGAWKMQQIIDKLRSWNIYNGLMISGYISGGPNQ
ncbi:MAG: hypothetical protein KBB32_06245 [Spirochaetia bacterium]|nr:hypothetical protein [Spirochaetia bacterium]